MKHKHYDCIVAWAEGKDIQWNNNGVWHNVIEDRPHWFKDTEYRIKPKPDYVRFAKAHGIYRKHQEIDDNIALTYDGETGALKSAEVLK